MPGKKNVPAEPVKIKIRKNDMVRVIAGRDKGKTGRVLEVNRKTGRLLIVDEPTRGVDIGAKAEIHNLLYDLARRGTAVVVISSDLPEVLAVADRVLVLCEGRLTGELGKGEATEARVMELASMG